MATASGPEITCQRCGTHVPWGPYCPHCHAYLEFAGVPPWSPDGPPEPEPDASAADEDQAPASDDAAESLPPASDANDGEQSPAQAEPLPEPIEAMLVPQVGVDEAPSAEVVEAVNVEESGSDSTVEVAAIAVESAPEPEPSGWSRWTRGIRTMRPRQAIGYLAGIVVALLLVGLLALFSEPGNALIAAPFLIAWAIISIGLFGTVPDVEHDDAVAAEAARLAAEAEAARLAELEAQRLADEEALRQAELEAQAAEPDTFTSLVGADSVHADEIAARPPQPVERTAHAALVNRGGAEQVRDVPCPQCGHLNLEGRHLCELCGATMIGAVVKPPVAALLEARVLEDEDEVKKGKRRKGSGPKVSRSWRSAIGVFAIVGVIVGAFVFAFFGPSAFQLRFSSMRAYQQVARWINPYVGDSASVASVTASSTLDGADATEAGFSDARTFWASAPSVGYGAGTTLTYTLSNPTEIDRMVIFPGIQSSQFDIRALATPADITLTFDDGTSTKATLEEVESAQQQRQLVKFDPVTTTNVKLTIVTIYPPRGEKADGIGSVAISGTEFLKVPPTQNFFGVQNGPVRSTIPGMGNEVTAPPAMPPVQTG